MQSVHLNLKKWYWVCQVSGWSAIAIFGIISTSYYVESYKWNLAAVHIAYASLNLLITHYSRDWLNQKGKFNGSAARIVLTILIFVITASMLSLIIMYTTLGLIYWDINVLSKAEIFSSITSTVIFFTAWISLYTLSKLFINYRKAETERLNLEIDLLQSELSVLKSQIKPHFIFNALNNVNCLIYEDPHKARQALCALSNFLRVSINQENNLAVPLEREMSIVEGYIQLLQIQLGKRLHVKWNIIQPKKHYLIPYLGFQTLVENSIKHGSFSNTTEAAIEIDMIENASSLTLTVKNPGKLNGHENDDSGIGLNNLRRRLQILDNKSSLTLSQELDNTVLTKLVLYPNEYMYN
jgi:two-component system, LytTR family, sensor kinase